MYVVFVPWLVCMGLCICLLCVSLSSHVCHLLPLLVAPPRADVVDASSHWAPSPVPGYYHTVHWLMNPWTRLHWCSSLCALETVSKCHLKHLVIIYGLLQHSPWPLNVFKYCLWHHFSSQISIFWLYQTKQLEVIFTQWLLLSSELCWLFRHRERSYIMDGFHVTTI